MEGYIASILLFGGNFAPNGWALCQGQILTIAQNTALFSLLGTTYGGNGQTTFALPDFRSRVAIGNGQGPGLSDYVLGEQAGSESTTLTTNNLPLHTHTITPQIKTASSNATSEDPNGNILATNDGNICAAPNTTNGNMAAGTITLANSGSTIPISLRQPYLGMNYIVCLYGIFPSRS